MTARHASLNVVCAHRGMYPDEKAWPFGESVAVGIIDGDRAGEVEHLTQRGRPDRRGGPVEFRCPRCGRNPRFSEKGWHLICQAWREDGRDTVDIAALP